MLSARYGENRDFYDPEVEDESKTAKSWRIGGLYGITKI